MGTPLALAGLIALAGCNSSPLTVGGDAGAAVDGAIDLRLSSGADLAGFCGDPNSARIEVNGMLAASPAVSATVDALNCCDAAELMVVSMQIPEPIVLAWRHSVGQPPNLPATLDAGNLPQGWSVTLYSRCSPTQPGCTPDDQYTTGIQGSLTVAGNGAAYQTSACLTAVESSASPHPVLHSLRLWIPTTATQ
ncbi:MAG TPA: hypothetical protein VFF06_32985 [Polyangia bacterium]|nr:hypothetical protein [Polyangia bacterium]